MSKIDEIIRSSCIICKKKSKEWNDYFKFKVCSKCYSRTELKKISDLEPPLDIFMNSLVESNDKPSVDALNLYSTLFPKMNSSILFELFLDNLDDKEMDEFYIKGMILAARSILLYGNDRTEIEKLDPNKFQALIIFGKCTNLAIMSRITENYKDFNGDIISILPKMHNEINQIYINILDDIKTHDDGSMDDLIIDTINLIYNNSKTE